MFRKFVRAAAAASIMMLAAVAGSAPASAASGPKPSKPLIPIIIEVQKLTEAKDCNGAMAKLKEADAVPDHSDYDNYIIAKFQGYCGISLQDYALATSAYEAMADSPALTDEDSKSTLHNAILLAAQAKHFDKAMGYAKRLEALGGMDDKTYAAAAQSSYFLNDMTGAQTYAQKSIDLAKAAGKQPEQAALEIVMSASAKQNNQQGAEQMLEELALNYNDPDNWGKLIEVAYGTKGLGDLNTLYLARLRYRAGAMKDADDYTLHAAIANQMGYPGEARDVLQAGISNGKLSSAKGGSLLSAARTSAAADERSLPTIAKSAAASKTGEQDVKLAEDYYGLGRYSEAADAATRAISKGGMKDPTEGNMVLGMTYVGQKKYAEAQAEFDKVKAGEARNKVAHLWSLYAQAQLKKAGTTAAAPTPAQ